MRRDDDWHEIFDSELARAETARASGNEGQARVCARRAAGIVVREYIARHNLRPAGSSAYDLLRYMVSLPGLAPVVYPVVEHFLVRITTDHTLPIQADLIEDARWLAKELLA